MFFFLILPTVPTLSESPTNENAVVRCVSTAALSCGYWRFLKVVRDRSDKPIKRRRVLTSKPLRMTGHLCGFEDGCRRFYSERVGNGYGNGAVSLGPQPGKKKEKSF